MYRWTDNFNKKLPMDNTNEYDLNYTTLVSYYVYIS